jgi:signal transduction histidine kinase
VIILYINLTIRNAFMPENIIPLQKLYIFREKIGIDAPGLSALAPYRHLFLERKEEFSDYFYNVFWGIPATRTILEGEKTPGVLKRTWSFWFESFFSAEFDDAFLSWLWKIGVRHVEVSLDQRFSNLGFAVIRQFCHGIVLKEVPLEERGPVLSIIDKLLDLCVLIETSAYIENTTSCDIEVMREMADRVRNPAMIIGWNIKRLQDKVSAESKEYKVYKMLMEENQRLEGMVKDIKVYMDLFQAEPNTGSVDFGEILHEVLHKLKEEGTNDNVLVDISLHQDATLLKGDKQELTHLFYYLIQNSMEAAGSDNSRIAITSGFDSDSPYYVRIEIFNTGEPPKEKVDQLFSPFFSTKLKGTGFGLPIAQVVVRKHLGRLEIMPLPGKGTSVIVSLPRAAL